MRVVVNGETRDVKLEPERSLLHVLREEFGLLAAKPGCGEGACGACTVLVDDEPIRSCTRPIADVAGRAVTTLEGLAGDPVERLLAVAFVEQRAMQCGFCTPGMLVAATALLRDHPDPTPGEIVAGLDGNVCRCGTYPAITKAIRRAVARRDDAGQARRGAQEPTPARVATHDPVAAALDTDAWALPAPWDLVEPAERDYFGRLGDGLVVVLPPDEAERVNDGEGAWSTGGGAWIHVGARGRVTAFTGKVDVGQDNRTALGLLVAEEIGVVADVVELVMGDTDVCPYDIGTFGSRSTVDAGAVLRAAAATARHWLLERAAKDWEVDAAELEIRDGIVESRDRGRSSSIGELLDGERALVFAAGDIPTVDPGRWQVAGRAGVRAAANAIVAGSLRYTSDLARPGMLHGRVLRPPAFGAALQAVDLSGPAAMPGVVAVHDGAFVGVAAPDPIQARTALGAIRADWRETVLPAEAELTAYLRAHPVEERGWGGSVGEAVGDVDAAFRTGVRTLEATYTAAYIAHVPLEGRAAVAEWTPGAGGDGGEPDGERVTIWTGTQRPFGVRDEVAEALGIAEDRVRIIVSPTGAGYGGKHRGDAAIEAARLARVARRPVKVRWNRREEFTWAYFRPAAVIDVRSAVDSGGRVTAWSFRNLNGGAAAIGTPYAVPNQRTEYQPAASPLRQGSYRALAATANNFARESHMDELAERCGLDPLAFRLTNLDDERLAAVLRAAAERAGWPSSSAAGGSGARVGLGLACGLEKGGRVATVAKVTTEAGGGVRLARIVTAFECGAIVDPDNLRSQVEGATVMGIGGARFEAVHVADGRIANGSMSDYRVPRFSDVPPIEVILIDRPDEPSAGAGETPIIAVAPAIANAIFAATGRRIRSLPLLPDDSTPATFD